MSAGFHVVLYVVTLGLYSWYWVYRTHREAKSRTGRGLGGVLGLLLESWIDTTFRHLFITAAMLCAVATPGASTRSSTRCRVGRRSLEHSPRPTAAPPPG